MTTIRTFEAKTRLSELLDRVAKGERIMITKGGKPVAMLVPRELDTQRDSARIGKEMLEYRDQTKRTFRGATFRKVAHEGHRY